MESSPPERPIINFSQPMEFILRSSPAVWIFSTSRAVSQVSSSFAGTNGLGLTDRIVLDSGSPCPAFTINGFMRWLAGKVDDRFRSNLKRSTSTSTIKCEVSVSKRLDSPSNSPFSYPTKWPPNTVSFVDSKTPALA